MGFYKYILILILGGLLNSPILFAQVLFVNIDVNPSEAEVYIDNTICFPNNGPLELSKGTHSIRIDKKGYFTIEEEIKISKKNVYFKYDLVVNPEEANLIREEAQKKLGYLTIISDEQAKIFINGKELLKRKNMEFEQQELEIIVYKTTCDSLRKMVNIVTNDTLILELYPKRKLNIENLNLEMVSVLGGGFMMGREGNKEDARLHSVELKDFYIGKYEVTQEQWEMVMGENPSQVKGNKLPVDNVSWNDVQVFLEELNKISKDNYRLPTEAEWEYAAKGGHKMNMEPSTYSGGNKLDQVGWYWKNSGDSLLTCRFSNQIIKQNHCKAHEVGLLEPNKLGIYDMTGNVWEWCSDWYSIEYFLESPRENPQGPATGLARVCKGGSYTSKSRFCKNGFRFSYLPSQSFNYLGFRLVRDK